jgi:hypothetical protein
MTWTVADGARGRRWRAVLVEEDRVAGSLLLECAPDGTPGKLEVVTAAGLLTLHPVGSMLHGNVARAGGVEHVALPWGDAHVLHVAGAPATAAAAARLLRNGLGVGEGRSFPGALVTLDLAVRAVTFRVARVGPRGWRFIVADTGDETGVTLDLEGIPTLAGAETWPLELDTHP